VVAASVAAAQIGARSGIAAPLADLDTTALGSAASFSLDPKKTEIKNPNAPELTISDGAGGKAVDNHTGPNGGAGHGGDWKTTYTWHVPTALIPGKSAEIIMGISIADVSPSQQLTSQMNALAPNFAQAFQIVYPGQSSGSKTFAYPFAEDEKDSPEVLVTVGMLSAQVVYHYTPSATTPGVTTGASTSCAKAATSPDCALSRIEDSPCYRQFFGLDDPATTITDWGTAKTERGLAVAHTALEYPDVTIEADIPGEGSSNVHSPKILYPGNDLFILLSRNEAPRDLFASGNIYARVTPRYELPLRQKILASPGDLSPADVLKLALDTVKEKDGLASYPLAVLTANNLLKNAAEIGREAVRDADNSYSSASRLSHPSDATIARHNDKVKALTETLCRWSALVGKLASLRANPAGSKDKIGPWYHAFTILTTGALVDGSAAKLVVAAEHTAKGLKLFGSEGGFDQEKFLLDSEFAATANQIDKSGLSRPRAP
jgi:hypothetical protein